MKLFTVEVEQRVRRFKRLDVLAPDEETAHKRALSKVNKIIKSKKRKVNWLEVRKPVTVDQSWIKDGKV